jgi:membrane associated rhomboid family serine protease
MFLHGSLLHLAGNMLFLWVFGNNVEDHLGWFLYPAFYLVTGIAAMAAHFFADPGSTVPVLGASGAIAGVMGAYLVLHPGAMIQVVIVPLFFIPFFVPAALLIVFWFIMQLLGGIADLSQTSAAGIAWWAHIGGFLAGLVLIVLAGGRRKARASPVH